MPNFLNAPIHCSQQESKINDDILYSVTNNTILKIFVPFVQVADGFILVYSVGDMDSFKKVEALRKFLETQMSKDKKEVGNIFCLLF